MNSVPSYSVEVWETSLGFVLEMRYEDVNRKPKPNTGTILVARVYPKGQNPMSKLRESKVVETEIDYINKNAPWVNPSY